MKAPREIRDYISRYREHLKQCRWDDLMVIVKLQTCKKWFKRNKRICKEEYDS